MNAMEELDIGMVQVGHSDTGVVEDINVRVNSLSRGTSNPGKEVSFSKKTERVSKRFTIDTHKLYFDSCAMYQFSFVIWMLGNVHQVSTVLKGNCNAGVSTPDENIFWPMGVLAQCAGYCEPVFHYSYWELWIRH